jgi:broad specificity phosphatase PhoE
MRILFVRHGESEANVQKIFSNSGWKHPLTESGQQSAAALATKLTSEGVTAIYTSPLQRAVQTAQAISQAVGVPYKIEKALVEYDVGIYEDRDHASGAQEYDDIASRWIDGDLDCRMTGGESCREIRNRVTPFIHQLIKDFADNPQATIVLVGHGGTYRHALPAILTNITPAEAARRGLGNTAYVEAHLRNRNLVCVRWAEELIP